MQTFNVPYVKKFDKNGTLLNPIKESYSCGYRGNKDNLKPFPNRRQRRAFSKNKN